MSHDELENQEEKASQQGQENHELLASHVASETQSGKASHTSQENQCRIANQTERGPHKSEVSQGTSETQPSKAESHTALETHGSSANLQEANVVRELVEVYYDVQDVRIRSFNRLRQVGEIKGVQPDILKKLEKQISDCLTVEIRDKPIYKVFLKEIKGIGPILAAGLISIFNPAKASHASGFWKYAGLHVTGNIAARREKGKKLTYNPHAKVLCWKIADSFIKQRTPFYRDIYDKAKEIEAEKLKHPENNPKNCSLYDTCLQRLTAKASRTHSKQKELPCKKHIDYRARRKMVKRFLLDLWLVWRKLEGLSVSEPYAVAILKHQNESN